MSVGLRRGIAVGLVALTVSTLVAFAGTMTAASGAGCTTSWKAAVSGDWATAANWTNGVPTAGSVVCITLPGTYTVTMHGFANAASLGLGGTSGSQHLAMVGACGPGKAWLELSSGALVGVHGALDLDSAGCYNALLSLDGGSFANAGVVTLSHAQSGGEIPSIAGRVVNTGTVAIQSTSALSGTWTNNGTISIADKVGGQFNGTLGNNGAINSTGNGGLLLDRSTFIYGLGTTSGPRPVTLEGGRLVDNGKGNGQGTIWIAESATLTGNIAAHQTIVLDADCTYQSMWLRVTADWTNKGTIIVASDGACLEHVTIQSAGKLTNDGVVRVLPLSATSTSSVFEGGSIDNEKTLEVAPGATLMGDGAAFSSGPSATLIFDVASAVRHGAIDFTSDPPRAFTLAGTLAVSTASTYWPASGVSFPIISGAPTGTFAKVIGLTRAGQHVGYHVGYSSTAVSLTAS